MSHPTLFRFNLTLFATVLSSNLLYSINQASAQELNFDEPVVAAKKESNIPSQVGPISNITLGGAVDWRVTHQNGATRPAAFIHVNEFVMSATVGPHIAVSAEQLLVTSELGSVVGQDHGFVTVSLIQLPFLPSGMTLKLGRFRGKFGLDAQVDSPANIFPSQALRSNGFVTDVGINMDYAFGDFEWIVESFNGSDYMLKAGQKSQISVSKPPIQTRIVYQPASNLKIGASAMMGQTWDNQVNPNILDMSSLGSQFNSSRTIERRRLALDIGVRTGFADLYAEGIYGTDKGRLAQPINAKETTAKGALARIDFPLFKMGNETRSKGAFQYDTWQDGSFNGRVAFVSGAFSVMNDDGWTARVGGSANDLAFQKTKPSYVENAPWSVTTQLLVSF